MLPHRTGPAALALGVATWAQLALVPVAAGRPDAVSAFFALLPLGVLAAAVERARRDPPRAAALALGAYPLALGLAAFVAGRDAVPRFDAASRVVAAATAVAYFACAVGWSRGRTAPVPVTVAPLDLRPASAAPRLRNVAMAALAVTAGFVGVLAPARLGAREPASLAERVAGEGLVRGRGALVTAAGALLAVAVVLYGGSSLLRASPPRPRQASRAAAYVVWAACAYLMRRWLDHAR